MTSTYQWHRWKGLRALLTDAVEQGTSAVERVHMATASRPFEILDKIPAVAPGARGVRLIHDATVTGVYETIRQVNRLVGATLSAAIDAVEEVTEAHVSAGEAESAAEPRDGAHELQAAPRVRALERPRET